MEIEIVNQDKTSIDIAVDNLTLIELLRNYLNKDSSVKLAAWKRPHPSKPPVLHVEATNPKATIKKAISAAQKDIDKYVKEFKAMK